MQAEKTKNMEGTRKAVEMENELGNLGVKLSKSGGKDKTLKKKNLEIQYYEVLAYMKPCKILANTIGLKRESSKQPNKLFPYNHQMNLDYLYISEY